MSENRFKKSVDAATYNTLDNALDNVSDNTLENKKEKILYNIKPNILDIITEKESKNRGGNHTFYLSAEVTEALSKLAKKTKRSKSILVNDILKAVLLENTSN